MDEKFKKDIAKMNAWEDAEIVKKIAERKIKREKTQLEIAIEQVEREFKKYKI